MPPCFLCSNQDRQASIIAALATLHYVVPTGTSPIPPIVNDSTQLAGSGDTEPLNFSDSKL